MPEYTHKDPQHTGPRPLYHSMHHTHSLGTVPEGAPAPPPLPTSMPLQPALTMLYLYFQMPDYTHEDAHHIESRPLFHGTIHSHGTAPESPDSDDLHVVYVHNHGHSHNIDVSFDGKYTL